MFCIYIHNLKGVCVVQFLCGSYQYTDIFILCSLFYCDIIQLETTWYIYCVPLYSIY